MAIAAAVSVIALQVAVMWRAPYADPVILPIVVLLNLLGIAVIASVDSANTLYTSRGTAVADRQMLWSLLGVALCIAVLMLLRDHRWLRRYTWIFAVTGAVLLLLPLDRKSTRLNSSHVAISYAVFCLKKKQATMTA